MTPKKKQEELYDMYKSIIGDDTVEKREKVIECCIVAAHQVLHQKTIDYAVYQFLNENDKGNELLSFWQNVIYELIKKRKRVC